MKKNSSLIVLIVCFILGFSIRVIGLSAYPPGLNWDEVSLGYNAYSLLKSGHDEWGKHFPIIFQAYGDYKLPLYVYYAVPTISIFGLTPVGVRLPSAIFGSGLIILTFSLSYRLFKNKYLGLIGAFLVAVSPWTVFLSRIAVEGNMAAFFISLGLYFGLTGKYKLSALFMGISVWTYNSARFFTPAVILFAVFHFRHKFEKIFSPLAISAVFIIPMFIQMFNPAGTARLGWLTLLDSGALAQIEASRAASDFPIPRLLYNKVTYFSYHFVSNYLSYLGPDFLFVNGGSHYQFNIPHLGLLAPVCSLFFYLGLFFLVLSKKPESKFLLLWLLLAPVAGSVTRDSPHTLRAITMLPLPMLISAFGFIEILKHSRFFKVPVTVIFVIGIVYSFWRFSFTYTSAYTRDYSWSWQYGHAQVVAYINSVYTDYDEIIFTKKYGEPHEFVLFYSSWSPEKYVSDQKLVRYFKSDWYWVDGFAKYRFINDWEMSDFVKSLSKPGKYLIVSGPDNQIIADKLLDVKFLDHKPAFTVLKKII